MAPPDIALNGHTSPRLSRSRSHSISSDRPSGSGYGNLLSPPVSTSPEPAFIAASAASQIVTNDHDSRSDIWLDQHGIEPSGETALVAPAALKLVNRFLDQLLFNFLSISRSTSLASLRPAVSEVLKPKLAKDAISGADQELQEYLGGGEDEELLAFHNGAEPNGDWDLELVWKRTRLRCMVYSSLGDMEEEDEDYYTEREQLDGPPGSNNRFSNNPGVVSPAVAIFLTSILEFMGEQALIIAGQAAYFRLRAKIEKEERDGLSTPASIAERVVVDESDMERVALDRTLGRLWRGWKKRVRSPTASVSMSRSFSRESLNSMIHGASRSGSIAPQEDRIEEDSPEEIVTEDAHAATIPLPISKDDVREIEIPGLALQSDDEDDEQDSNEEIKLPTRPKSMMVFTQMTTRLPTPNSSQPDTPQTPGFLSSRSRKRSNSMPTPAGTPYSSPSSKRVNPASGDGLVTTADPAKATAEDAGEPKGFVAGVAANAVAIGAAAVAGITAAANGEAPQTALVNKDETDPELLYEEPQVMTISSFSTDESISPIVKDSSRRSSMRSHSIHSLRVIDVASPRSASPRSPMTRQSSTDDYVSSGARVVSLSRPASLHSPIIVDASTPRGTSPILRSQTASPVVRNGSALSSRQARNSAEESISEAEEKDVVESPVTAIPAEIAAAMQGVSPGPESQHFQSGSTTKVAEKPLPFILGAPPPPRNAAREAAKKADNRPTQLNNATSSTPSAFAPETAAPPLTPLREMVEAAPDTSDESSSITPSQKTRSSSEAAMSNQDSEQTPKARAPTSTSRNSPPRSTAKAQRSLHTSRSSSSSISKVKPTRTSEDSSRTEHGQSFEELIRSDQTIQYTLTPENMRNIEGDSPPANALKAQNVRPPTGRSHSSSIGKHTGLHSNPPADSGKSSKPVPKSIPTPPSNTGSRRRPGAPQARDAKIDRDSIGDFAEFIRSTGPPGSFNDVPSRPPVAINGHRGANGIPKLASGSAPRVTPVSTLPRRAESSAGRNRLQARDAVVPNGDTSSDLIDFIRQGPPSTNFDDHRIPRTVAPFRTTMDSDQMAGAVGGKAIDASLPDPRYSQTSISNDQSMQSKTSSINSQSALLNNSSSKTKKPPTSYSSKNDFDEDMMPKRKTRRVRDPYAIDFSDEEDKFEVAASRKPAPIKEESLADFLRNVPPPPDNDPPVLASLPQKDIRKKASAPSLMSRFGRKETTPPLPPKPQSSKGYESRSAPSRNGNGAPPLPTHTPLNVKPSASSPPLRGNADYVSQLDTARNPPTGRVVQKSYQPREPSINRTTRTSDLADFLRSDPPPGMTGPSRIQTTPVHQREESSGFSRMFGRRRKHSVAT